MARWPGVRSFSLMGGPRRAWRNPECKKFDWTLSERVSVSRGECEEKLFLPSREHPTQSLPVTDSQ